jgi:serine/threonine-protein kinase
MIELRTIGTVDLRNGQGGELRPVLQQPKRVALLVYLAVAKPGAFHRRDSLLGLFWPELDQEHARAALRRAIYFLRQALGPDVVPGRGDEEIGIDSTALWCDVLAFDAAIRAKDHAAAMALYRGPFLEGFYVQGAQDAEAWLDRERARLRQEAAQAAWSLAELALPVDPAEATRWGRRAIDLGPDDEDSGVRFLERLEVAGDRTSAVRLADQLVERLATDFAREPGPALTALAARLRGGEARSSAGTGRTAPRREASVAVCPFSIRGDASLAYLGEGMVDLLSTKLDGAGELRTCDPGLVLRAARKLPDSASNVDRGLAVAAELGTAFFLTGAIVESGGALAASLGLYQADGALRVRAEARATSEAELFDLVDELVRRVLAGFDQSAGARLARLAALTTTALPALKAYLQGEHEFRLGRNLQALDAYRRATIEDPSFALAYYRLGSALAATALVGPARQASAAAHEHRDRVSDHDRLLLDAQHAWLHGRGAEAERRYAALTITFPEQVEPWFLLGDLLFHSNPYRGRSITEARGPFERTLELDPTHLGAVTHLARIAALEGRAGDVDRLVSRSLDLSPAADHALGLRILRAFALGRREEEPSLLAELARGSGLGIARAFSDVALYARDLDGAERMAEATLPAARSAELQALGEIIRAHLAMARGRRALAAERLRSAARHEPAWALEVRGLFAALPFGVLPPEERRAVERELLDWDAASTRPAIAVPLVFHDGLHAHLRLFLLGLLRVRAADPSGVMEAASSLSELPVPAGALTQIEQLSRTLDAEALRLQGRNADALAALERASGEVWFQYAVGSPFFAGTYQRLLRAELLADAGRIDEALGWLRTVAERSPYELLFLARAERRQAELLARTGQLESARKHEARAQAIWREDD